MMAVQDFRITKDYDKMLEPVLRKLTEDRFTGDIECPPLDYQTILGRGVIDSTGDPVGIIAGATLDNDNLSLRVMVKFCPGYSWKKIKSMEEPPSTLIPVFSVSLKKGDNGMFSMIIREFTFAHNPTDPDASPITVDGGNEPEEQ